MRIPVVVATLIASLAMAPGALAQSQTKKVKKTVSRPPMAASMSRPAADPYAVYVSGEYIGRDPDPNIRAYLTRNPHDWDGPD